MTRRILHWPREFFWGTATSAYQIEGRSDNTDWWRFERAEGSRVAEVCGDACDSWNRFGEDLDILASLGLNSYRLSLEWARIEPSQGVVSREAIDHYREVLRGCRERAITPFVTLHHFTLPLWVADAGGFESPRIVEWLGEYARLVGETLGDLIGVACTINEPNIVAVMGYLLGSFPPAVTDWSRFVRVNATMRDCHVAMRDALREGQGEYPIGLPLSMQEYEALPGGEDQVAMVVAEMEDLYLAAVADDDYLGVQCYTKLQIGHEGLIEHPEGELTEMGYLFWPQSVEYTVRRAARATGLPIIVTENGIGTNDDAQRVRYLTGALQGLRNLLDDGIDVRGYFQWSLLDNFEWTFGYRPKFGIVAVDRTTFARTLKPSAHWYAAATRAFAASETPSR
ncbi:MAG TPA: family 1 glycosylhydrolase [Acidimicrobiales bacterium]|nr:family 1 glycosylhydrolase [Acidimicrobiales bacterium]